MATVVNEISSASGNAVTELSWSHTLSGGNIAFVMLAGDESNINTTTIDGINVTKTDQTTGPSANATVSVWFASEGADGIAAGTHTVHVTNFFTENMQCVGVTVNNADQNANIFAAMESTVGSGTGTSSSRATSGSSSSDLVLSVICFPTSASATPTGTGHVELVSDISGSVIQTAFGQKPGASGTTTNWTLSSSVGWAHANISIDNEESPDVEEDLTGVSATAAVGSVSDSVSKTLTGVAATTAEGDVDSVAASRSQTGVAATGQTGDPSVGVTKSITGAVATAATGDVSATVGAGVTGVGADGQTGTPTVALTTSLTGVEATGEVGTVTAEMGFGADLTGVQATGQVGDITFVPPLTLSGIQATMQVGIVTPTVHFPQGKSHTDLSVRQWLEVIYEREWREAQAKKEAELAERNKPKTAQQPRKVKAVRKAIKEDPYLLVNREVMRLAAQTQGLREHLASLQTSFSIQSQLPSASSQDDDDDLLLFSAIL